MKHSSSANPTHSRAGAIGTAEPGQDNAVSVAPVDELTQGIAATIASCSLNWVPPKWFALRLRAGSELDFIVQDHGTIWTFRARSDAARSWWVENVRDGPCLGRNWPVEHRYAWDILDGLQRDGFTVVTGRAA